MDNVHEYMYNPPMLTTQQLAPLPKIGEFTPGNYITSFECEVLRETDRALQIRRGDRTTWVPRPHAGVIERKPGLVCIVDMRVWLYRRVVDQLK